MVFGVAALEDEEQILQIWKRVRLEVTEKDSVILVLKSVTKAQRVQTDFHGNLVLIFIADNHLLIPVVVGGALTIHGFVIVFVVTHIMAATLPLMGTVMSVLLLRVDKRFHSNCICAFIFLQIVDIEAHRVSFTNVSNGEEVPLRVVECIVIKV